MTSRDRSSDESRPTGIRSTRTTRRTFVKAAGAGAAGLALGGFAGSAAAVDNPTPRLGTDGKWIVNEDGERVKLRGFATASLDFLEQHHPYSITEVLEMGTDGEEWHPNTIRLPITEHAFVEQGADYVVDDLLRPAVDLLADRGVYAMIDFHLIRPYLAAEEIAPQLVEDGWADTVENLGFEHDVGTDDLLTDFWSAVAPEFADDEHVLYELFNEPTLPNWWSGYTDEGAQAGSREDSWLLWRDEAQSWVDLIQEEAPEAPIIIGSPDWTSETQFAPQHPFEGENLIYSGHIYPDNGLPYEAVERENDDGSTYEVGPFDPEYGAPADDVPVIITEFGWDPDEEFAESVEYGTTSEWGEAFREWAESYENMGWIGWCFDDSWAPTYFDSPNEGANTGWELKDGEEEQGWFMRQWLEDTQDDMIVGEGGTEPCADGIEVGDYCAQDATGDGLHEDVNGDGEPSQQDVAAFFEHLESDAVQGNPDAFNFDGEEGIGFSDIVALFQRV